MPTDIVIQVVQQSALSIPIEVIAGAPGLAATVSIGTTTTGASGTAATVSNSGTSAAAILNFTIPRGDPGNAAFTWADITGKPSTFPPSAHTHAIADVNNLQTTLDGKASLSHAHIIADVTGLQAALDGKQASGSYAAAVHTHAIADVTSLQTALDGKQAAGSYAAAVHTHVIADTTGLQTALDGKAASVHTHAIADVTGLQTLLDDANGTPLNQATVKVVYNQTGSTISKGQAVYVNGSQGTRLTVALADATSEATAARTIGIAAQNIAHNATGYIICVGVLSGLNTNALTEGQTIWLAPSAGGLTTTRPTQPNHGVILGWCVKQGAGASGIIYIKVDNGLELYELHDVLITTPTNDQVLTYESATGLWKNKTPSGITNGQSIVNALIFG
jgi:hypothetical protein